MRISDDGRVMLPPEIQEQSGLKPGIEVDISVEDGAVRLVAAKPRPTLDEARAMVRRMQAHPGDFGGMSGTEFVRWLRGPSADEELAGRR